MAKKMRAGDNEAFRDLEDYRAEYFFPVTMHQSLLRLVISRSHVCAVLDVC